MQPLVKTKQMNLDEAVVYFFALDNCQQAAPTIDIDSLPDEGFQDSGEGELSPLPTSIIDRRSPKRPLDQRYIRL